MATPGKVSLKKKSRKLFTPRVQQDEEDFELEKENSDQIGALGTFKPRCKSNRRNSTILAGNLTILNQEVYDQTPLSPNVTLRRRKKLSPGPTTKELEETHNDLLTEDETSFYSCDESLNRNQVFEENDPWMTELTEDDDVKCKTPVNNCNQPNGENPSSPSSAD